MKSNKKSRKIQHLLPFTLSEPNFSRQNYRHFCQLSIWYTMNLESSIQNFWLPKYFDNFVRQNFNKVFLLKWLLLKKLWDHPEKIHAYMWE